ncbi:MAG: FAD-dependent oxidoreductase [Oscillospiraceae bacterium]
MVDNVYSSDVLVIGGGVAGLFAAITARGKGRSVILVDKAYAGKSGSSIMASGQWNVFNPDWGLDYDDSFSSIQRFGGYICHAGWLDVMLRESWESYRDLVDYGVEFPCTEDEMKDFMREKMHGDRNDAKMVWGMVPLKHREVPPKLRRRALLTGVKIFDRIMITELTVARDRVTGAAGFAIESAEPVVFRAGAVILCGGKNCFRSPGMNIAELTGDADAMAYRAGACISGKEFPDMHMNIEKHPVWKGNGELYPAFWNFVDGEGRLIPQKGFDLAMASVIHAGLGPIMWDFAHAGPEDLEHMENYIKKRGLPQETERVNLGWNRGENTRVIGGSAAGGMAESTAGIWPVDLNGASTMPGLYAAGDCCCTWAWGAIDRFGPPGLMHAAVSGKRAAKAASEYASENPVPDAQDGGAIQRMLEPLKRKTGFDPRWVTQLLQNTMLPYYVLHIKKADRLEAALTTVEFLRDHMGPKLKAGDPHELRLCHETRNMILNAEMILRASLERRESRGWHYREDYPDIDDENWLAWVIMRRGENGMEVSKRKVPQEFLPPPSERKYERPWLAWEVY